MSERSYHGATSRSLRNEEQRIVIVRQYMYWIFALKTKWFLKFKWVFCFVFVLFLFVFVCFLGEQVVLFVLLGVLGGFF